MGFAAGSSCFVDAAIAASHLCASLAAVGDGSVTACSASAATESSADLTMARTTELGTTTFAVSVPMQPCNPLTAADAFEVGWGLVAVAVAALVVNLLRAPIK